MRIELVERDDNLYVGPNWYGEWVDVSNAVDGVARGVSFTYLCAGIEQGAKAIFSHVRLVRPAGRTVALWQDGHVWTTDASRNARVLLGRDYAPLGQDAFDRILTDATLQASKGADHEN